MEIITKSAAETKEVGKKFASGLSKKKKAVVLALVGDLGSGKTTFVQGLGEGFKVKGRILSPTFIIVRRYELKGDFRYFYHIDLYRLEGNLKREIENLGIDEIWEDPENLVVIEWAEKIKEYIPKDAVWINFENMGERERRLKINDSNWV